MYWSERQKQLYEGLEKDEAALKRRLITYYSEESASLDKDIAAYYQKYGENGVIKYRTLKKSLSNEERQLLMRNCDEFAKKYPQYADLMPIRKSIYKLDRLEGLQCSIMLHQYNIGAITQAELDKHLRRQVLKGVNAAQEALGFGKNFYAENADVINLFVGVPWANGKDFSQTIWDNADKLINYLKYDFASGIARGDSYQKLTDALQNRFLTVNKNDAYRLVYTEGTYVMAESTMQPFTEDFEQYKVSTAADGKVCSKCADISHQVFYIKDRTPGVNFPPMHPWCRCTFEIYVEDWDKWQDDYVKRHGGLKKDIAKKIKANISDNSFNKKTHFITKLGIGEVGLKALNEYISSKSYNINEKLRKNLPLTNEEKTLILNLDEALEQMPTYQGDLTRSLYFMYDEDVENFIKQYQIGDVKEYPEFLSTTFGAVYNEKAQVQINIVNSKRGRDISKYNSKEKEVLYQRNSKFRVINIKQKEKVWYLILEEI